MPVATSEQLLGTELGRYRLERILGEGGMGCVYLGVDAERGSRVAIKVLSKQTPDAIQRFLAEARAVSLISHFNIVNLVDLSELPDGRPYMVMELVEGQSLRDAAPTATLAQIGKVCCEVLAALEAAHEIGIVHRDLKPDNIMMTRAGHAKVLDFGVAKLAPGIGGGLTPRTKDGLTMGTPAYMAPEQVTGGAIDARTDLYTMGVVLFEALTGQRPFSGGTDLDIMRAHRDRTPPRPRVLAPTIPPAVEDVILRALSKDPAKRFQTASEMATALSDAIEGRASARKLDDVPTVRGKPLPAKPAPVQPSRIPAMLAVAAIAIAATVVFVIARARRNSHHPPDAPIAVPVDAAEPDADAPATPDAAVAEIPMITDAATTVATDAAIDAATDAAIAAAPDAAVADTRPPKTTLPDPITRAADYSTDGFDPIAYLGRATELAQKLAPDAQLVEVYAGPVDKSHRVDLSRASRRVEYRYLTPSGAKADAAMRPCIVVVSVTPASATARVQMDKRCAQKPIAPPRCSLERVRQRIDGAYVYEDVRYTDFAVTFRGHWTVDITHSRDGTIRVELPDC